MQVEHNKVVTFHYTLSGIDGDQLEASPQTEPMTYLHGHGNILPALEHEMLGKKAEDDFQLTLESGQAYGPRRENAEQRIPLKRLSYRGKLRAGMRVKINTEQGARDARVIKVGKFNADVDTNHPLAGMTLSFHVNIVAVRDATTEEIAHGHVHGAGGHAH